jgi:hypothetical protein
MIELLRSRFQDKGEPGSFAYNQIIPWIDAPLQNATDGNHFNDNDDSYPQGWTEVDAAFATDTNSTYGFWYLEGNTVDLSWKYRTQLSVDIESDVPSGDWVSFIWGPILFRDFQSPSDLTYYFGLYADSGGSIDEDIFIRTAVNWDSSGGIWRVRGERKDGSTQTNDSWFTLSSYPPPMPIYVRSVIRYSTTGSAKRGRAYVGSSYIGSTHTQLSNAVPFNVTWGQVWMQCHQSRNNTGINDYLLIGGIDRGSTP